MQAQRSVGRKVWDFVKHITILVVMTPVYVALSLGSLVIGTVISVGVEVVTSLITLGAWQLTCITKAIHGSNVGMCKS